VAKPKPVNTVRNKQKPVPSVGTQIAVQPSHLFVRNSIVPAVRIKCDAQGIWSAIDPNRHEGLIVFINDVKSKRPRQIQITEVQATVVFAREV